MHTRFIKIRNVLIIILFLNWAVAFAKIIYGFLTRSTAISADGFHSFSDGSSNLIGIIGIWVASQPQDRDHPYGHKKYETFSSIIIAILLFIISFNIIRSGFLRFFDQVIPDVGVMSFVVMLATMGVNAGVFLYEKKQARIFKSDILAADAQHTKSDILVSASVIFTLIAVYAGLPVIDSVVSIFIGFLIARSGIKILETSSNILCDRIVIDEAPIRELVLRQEGIKDCHKIRTRGRKDDIHLDLHVMVDPDITMGQADQISHRLEQTIKQNIENITDIVIHIEPFYDV
jgi:cation diffusion facilitator family transporter